MRVTTYLRYPGLLLAAVAFTIAVVWYALGYPAQLPRSPLGPGEKLDCLSYAPAAGTVTLQKIEADLVLLAPHAGCVRTYATGTGLDRVPEVARRLNLQVLQGVALGRDSDRNDAEIERAVALARAHRAVVRAFVVGSEVLSRGELATHELGEYIRRVRERTGIPVTYADRWEVWLNATALAPLVDFVTIHVELYHADIPVSAADAVRRMLDARARVATRIGSKDVMVGEIGWPSAGRMREAALPSLTNQARLIHDLVAAAKAGNFQLNIFEGQDERWRGRIRGTASAHWGLLDGETGEIKFRWGRAVSDHPLWFYQGLLGIMLALVVFAAAFLAARSLGHGAPARVNWRPVALIALAAGMFVGWSVAEMPLQSDSLLEWVHAAFLIALAVATPPAAAAALVHGRPIEGFGALLDPDQRPSVHPLGQIVAVLFVLTVVIAIQLALGLVFDPSHRDFAGAALTGPTAALLILALERPAHGRARGVAEAAAALILAVAALFIAINETFWNWQALWFALTLLTLAAACWRARGVRAARNR